MSIAPYGGYESQREAAERARVAGRVTIEVGPDGRTSFSSHDSDPMLTWAAGRSPPHINGVASFFRNFGEQSRAGQPPGEISQIYRGDTLRQLVELGHVSHRDAQAYARALYAQIERERQPGQEAGNRDLVEFVQWNQADHRSRQAERALMGYSEPRGRGTAAPTLTS